MKYKEEINEISGLINVTSNNYLNSDNFAKTLQDEELKEGVTYLTKKETGLNCDIIVDCGETYKYFDHQLCLYVVNGNSVIPVTISNPPRSITGYIVPQDVVTFIENNFANLIGFANMEIDGPDFLTSLENKDNVAKMVMEMSNYGPDKTGLPIWVYVDDTNSYLKSGHSGSYRMKFQQDKSIKNPRKWMPVTIPDLQIMDKEKIPPCKEPKKNIRLVIEWAKGNMELLIELRDGNINGTEFKNKMKTMDEIKVLLSSDL